MLLWALAAICIALTATLRLCGYLQIEKAGALWGEYGLALILSSVAFAILALFKTYGEREKPNLSLIANEEQSLWAHSTQADGSLLTQWSLRFQATNMGDTTIQLLGIKLNRTWVRRKSIITKMLHTRHPTQNVHSSRYPIMAHSLTEASATIIIKGAVGGIGKKGTIRVSVQDHAGRWHKLVFRHLRNPAATA
jgi:4-amino-4-deoxy-L-arabinose transferase-like glycosyltransferase